MKILYITTIGLTMGFFNSFIRQLLDEGNDVEIATNETDAQVPECYREWGCQIHPISCTRFPFDLGNMKAISQIRRIVKENGYDIVHCHTPIAAMCTRIACRPLRKNGLKVFYTAHGFHFYDGAPLKNWLIYYPVEKWLSKYTDILITINKEDFRRATEKFHAKKTVYIPGVGVDTEKFAPRASGRERIRTELELKDSDIMILSVGELNENKNHETVIRAIKGLNVTYVIAGKGEKQDKLETIAKEYGVDLRLLGFRTDVSDIYDAADVFVLPSIREGLNVSLMEAMATGLSCAVSKIRGNTDLIEDETVLFDPLDKNGLRMAVKNAIEHRTKYGQKNLEKIRGFDIGAVRNLTDEIYMAGGGVPYI